MKRILILVEGQTEERFVKDVLQSHLLTKKLLIIPSIVRTRRDRSGKTYKGGVSGYNKIKQDLQKLFNDTDARCITTMLDYYRLPQDFPKPESSTLALKTVYNQIQQLEEAFALDINKHRFIPFLMLHEFETLLFSDVSEVARAFPDQNILPQLQEIRGSFASVEEINGGEDTHPSARMRSLVPSYRKVAYGPPIASRIGLLKIREQCTHFNEWLAKLESI